MNYSRNAPFLLVIALGFLLVAGTAVAQESEGRSSSLEDDFTGELDEDLEGGMDLPSITLEVLETHGSVQTRGEKSSSWKRVNAGDTLGSGQKLRTDESSTAALKIPGIALFEVQESTRISVDELRRSTESQGFLVDEEEVTVNEVSLNAEEGELDQSFREREGVENDYRLETPNAVAGVRGTTFECRTEGAFTECTVLDGSVTLSSRFADDAVELGPLQRSRVTEQDTSPSVPESVDEEEVQDLQETQDRSQEELSLEPVIRGLSLNGNEMNRSEENAFTVEIDTGFSDSLELSGVAQAREEGSEIDNVRVTRDGNQLEVEGTQNWSTEIDAPGRPDESTTIELTLVATDTQELESASYSVTVVLQPPVDDSEQPSGVPDDTREGDFNVSLESFNDRSVSAEDFPLGVEAGDTGAENLPDLEFSGGVDVDSPVAGVAYRLSEGDDWQVFGSTSDWTLSIPFSALMESGELNVEVMAWTEDGYQSPVAQFGPIQLAENEQDQQGPPANAQSTENVRLQFGSVGGRSLAPEDFPDTFTIQDLENGELSVSGSVQTDSDIEGVAYSLDDGSTWEDAEGTNNWSFSLTPEEGALTVQVVAWTRDGYRSNPLSVGPIVIRDSETTTPGVTREQPWDYEVGSVDLEVRALADRPRSDLEFPYHFYQGDANQGGIEIRGEASSSRPIEGVAYSLDNGQTWEKVQEAGEEWSFNIPAQSNWEYTPTIIAWNDQEVRSSELEMDEIRFVNSSYSQVLREEFDQHWQDFSNGRVDDFTDLYAEDFEYRDSLTGEDLTLTGFDDFLNDFNSDVSNLRVFNKVNQEFASPSGGEIQFSLEWRGRDDRSSEPFLMFGRDARYQYRRGDDGQFEVINFDDFPLVEYLYHRETAKNVRFGDGLELKSMRVAGERDAHVITESLTPDFGVNEIKVGENYEGGILSLGSSDFDNVDRIPRLGSGYKPAQEFSEGDLLAVNLRDQFGTPLTSLIKILDFRSDFVEVQVISAITPPGLRERAFVNYREINPYQ